MPGEPGKRTKREEYKASLTTEEQNAELPKKKFYRQRAHANPFSDHSLT
jgi:tRNA (guanine-N7-)-methyltransferase